MPLPSAHCQVSHPRGGSIARRASIGGIAGSCSLGAGHQRRVGGMAGSRSTGRGPAPQRPMVTVSTCSRIHFV